MNKNLRIVMAGLLINTAIVGLTFAQKDNVGIGTTKPDQSAALDISSSNKGLLVPRMSLEQRGSIQTPANGLMIYQTDFLSGFYYFDGKEWKPLTNATDKASIASATNWQLAGNSTIDGSGFTTSSFLGTTDNNPLLFRVNNLNAGTIGTTATQATFLGNGAGNLAATGVANSGFGQSALKAVTTGAFNLAMGVNALFSNTSGDNNMSIGVNSLFSNISGARNTAIGTNALNASTGNDNTAIGGDALNATTGGGNVAVGSGAGTGAGVGASNVFIGTGAGAGSTSVQKLYIANTNTTTPLVYGDFNVRFLSVGAIPIAKRDAIASSGVYGLLVEKGILTEKLKVATVASVDWADYVFEKNYKMMPLEEVEKFVKTNKHLPNVPSADEMSKNGLDVVGSDSKLLEKIEELTLYMIEMNKEIKALKQANQDLKKQIRK